MSLIPRLRSYAVLALVTTLYLPVVVLLTGGPGPEADPATYWFSVFAGLIILLVFAGWGLAEARLGRILPPVTPPRLPKTPAQRRQEALGTAALCAIIALTGGAAPAVALAQTGSLTLLAATPLLIWAWQLRIFGFTRLRYSAMLVFGGGRRADTTDRARLFLTGLALHAAYGANPAPERIKISVNSPPPKGRGFPLPDRS